MSKAIKTPCNLWPRSWRRIYKPKKTYLLILIRSGLFLHFDVTYPQYQAIKLKVSVSQPSFLFPGFQKPGLFLPWEL